MATRICIRLGISMTCVRAAQVHWRKSGNRIKLAYTETPCFRNYSVWNYRHRLAFEFSNYRR